MSSKIVALPNLSAKYLVDYLALQGWPRNHEDSYLAGQLLAEVLPRFTADPQETADRLILLPQSPAPKYAQTSGNPDWSKFTPAEADEYRASLAAYGRNFIAWARTPAPPVELSDAQQALCRRCIKYFSPRTPEEKKDDKQERPELPSNEFVYYILRELGLAPKAD